jgi:hypothetical protein
MIIHAIDMYEHILYEIWSPHSGVYGVHISGM